MAIAVVAAFIIFTLGVIFIPTLIVYINDPWPLNTTTTVPSILNKTCDFGYIFNGTLCDSCGLTDTKPNIKIVGGIPAASYSWPSQVMIIQSYTFYFAKANKSISLSFLCGGTIISSRTILTAAHCIQDKSITYPYGFMNYEIPIELNEYHPTLESMFTIYASVHEKTDLKTSLVLSVMKYLKHPDYEDSSFSHDIALLVVSEAISFDSKVKPACLPREKSSEYPSAEQDCYVAGWGRLSESGKLPNEMHNVKLRVYNRSSCSILSDSATQICAGEYSGGKDTCQGDSGGALLVYDENTNRQVIAGITSYGSGCARPRSPGVYTRTSYYLDWIREHMIF